MKLLFVCIGNTCRSPMAETVMAHLIKEHDLNWKTDSAALRSWNVGREPEERCIKVLSENGLNTQHIGREINAEDFNNFDYIFGMDKHNMEELEALFAQIDSENKPQLRLLGSYIGRKEDEIIQDPYFSSGIGGFRYAYLQILESCNNFIQNHK